MVICLGKYNNEQTYNGISWYNGKCPTAMEQYYSGLHRIKNMKKWDDCCRGSAHPSILQDTCQSRPELCSNDRLYNVRAQGTKIKSWSNQFECYVAIMINYTGSMFILMLHVFLSTTAKIEWYLQPMILHHRGTGIIIFRYIISN